MKKNYISPTFKSHKLQITQITCATTGFSTTPIDENEMGAKQASYGEFDDEEDYGKLTTGWNIH